MLFHKRMQRIKNIFHIYFHACIYNFQKRYKNRYKLFVLLKEFRSLNYNIRKLERVRRWLYHKIPIIYHTFNKYDMIFHTYLDLLPLNLVCVILEMVILSWKKISWKIIITWLWEPWIELHIKYINFRWDMNCPTIGWMVIRQTLVKNII